MVSTTRMLNENEYSNNGVGPRRDSTSTSNLLPPGVGPSVSLSTTTTSTHSFGNVLNSVLAGYAAGISGTLVGHPFDSAKVWLQTQQSCRKTTTTTAPSNHHSATISETARNPGPTTSHFHHSPTSTSMMNVNNTSRAVHTASVGNFAASRVLEVHSCGPPRTAMSSFLATTATVTAPTRPCLLSQVRAFYAGVAGPLLTVGLVQSINFGIYDSVRRALWHRQLLQQQKQGDMSSQLQHCSNDDYYYHNYLHNDSLTNVAISSAVAGAVLAFVTSPMLITKTRQQTVAGLTFRQALRQTMQRGMFVGFAPHFLAETVGRAVYFSSYEALKRSFVLRQPQAESGDAFSKTTTATSCSLHQRMISAALSGILCWSLIFPLDALRCRIYAQQHVTLTTHSATTTSTVLSSLPSAMKSAASTIQMARQMSEAGGGIKAFYRGFGVTVVRAGPVAAAVLPMYDWVLELLSSMDYHG